MYIIPDTFIRTMQEVNGEAGLQWAKNLPELLANCAQQWSLNLQPHFPNLSYNYVLPATQHDGTEVVLKIGYPDKYFRREVAALTSYDGRGIARLLKADQEHGRMLLERLQPGRTLRTITDEHEAMSIAASVLKQLWRPVTATHLFPTIETIGKDLAKLRPSFAGTTGPFPQRLVEEAERLFEELVTTMGETVLLHGDFHHDNILSAQREPWLAIDPKGLVGEPAYDTGALLRNPKEELLAATQPGRILAYRVDLLSEQLGIERSRIRGWGIAQAVLSAFWTYEDHGKVDTFAIGCAQSLAASQA